LYSSTVDLRWKSRHK